ncbi:MAG: hypothetical protein JXA69_11465 [Phycisphaerae bacterium]|nr:hypothetical protein [Phycisphaerae bacterium]
MGNNARRKDRQRQKRKEKKAAIRRAQAGSPYRLLAAGSAEVVACYINTGWKDEGLASIQVLKRLPNGSLSIGAFLVDLWCIGLKDCFGRLNVIREDFNDSIERMRANMDIERIDPAIARRLVLGAIRFSKQNGFRLPPRHERWVAMLGNPSDWRDADLGDFGTDDGKLRYVGEMEDLRKRLIGCSLDDFLARNNIDFLVGSPLLGPYDDEDANEAENVEEDDEDIDAAMEEIAEDVRSRFLDGVRQWCFATQVTPHPRLDEAIDLILESMFQVRSPDIDDLESDEAVVEASENMDDLLALERPDVAQQLNQALLQVRGFMHQFSSAEKLTEAMGLPADPELL